MSVQNFCNTVQTYGVDVYNWVATNGSSLLSQIADLVKAVWERVLPYLQSGQEIVMNNQGVAAVVGVTVGAGALLAASWSRIVDCILCRTAAPAAGAAGAAAGTPAPGAPAAGAAVPPAVAGGAAV